MANEVAKATAGQNVERSATEDLAEAIGDDQLPGPADLDLETFDPRYRPGQIVVIGQTDSPDNPKRYAQVHDGVQVVDIPTDDPLPDDPTGEDLMKPSDNKSRVGRLADKTVEPSTIEGTKDAASAVGNTVQGLLDDVKPTGSYVGTPDRPVATSQQSSSVDIGMIFVGAPIALGVAVSETVRYSRSKLDELKRARGDTPDGGH